MASYCNSAKFVLPTFLCNTFPMKATVNLSKICSISCVEDSSKFYPINFVPYGVAHLANQCGHNPAFHSTKILTIVKNHDANHIAT